MKQIKGLARVMPVQIPLLACPHAFFARQIGKPACSCKCRYCSAVLTMLRLMHPAPLQGVGHA